MSARCVNGGELADKAVRAPWRAGRPRHPFSKQVLSGLNARIDLFAIFELGGGLEQRPWPETDRFALGTRDLLQWAKIGGMG